MKARILKKRSTEQDAQELHGYYRVLSGVIKAGDKLLFYRRNVNDHRYQMASGFIDDPVEHRASSCQTWRPIGTV